MFAAPAVTPAPILAAAAGAGELDLRQVTAFTTSSVVGASNPYSYYGTYNAACGDLEAALTCDNGYFSCIESAANGNNYYSAIEACACQYGLQYLNCFYTALSTSSCDNYLGISDWGDFERSWYSEECGSVPATVWAALSVPTSVSLEFETVTIVTATGVVTPPALVDQPIYQGSGQLLQGDCTSTQFTLIDDGNTVYFAPFVGCVADRPQCCPWTAAVTSYSVASGTTQTITPTQVGNAAATGNSNDVAYPLPQNADQAVLSECAADYYSISGGCCPTGYYPFTAQLGGQTPCWSSLNDVAEPPTLTAGLAGEPTDTSKPTSAVVNVIWAMQYPVTSSGGSGSKKLSTGAIVGIAVGGAVVIILLAVGIFFCMRMRRNKKTRQAQNPQGQQPQQYPPQYQQQPGQQPQMMQQPVPNGAYPPGPPVAMMDARASMISSATTPTSGGATISDINTPGSAGPLANGGYFAPPGNGRISYGSNAGSLSPPPNGQAYPAPIAEGNEGQYPYGNPQYPQQPYQGQYNTPPGYQQGPPNGQYYQPMPGQQHPGSYPTPPPQQLYPGQAFAQPPQGPTPPQGGYQPPEMYASQQPQFQQQPPQQSAAAEMSAAPAESPPQEIGGTEHEVQLHHEGSPPAGETHQ